ncbi:hypothetical protein SAY87_032014 [Trapa incisa]|uniref:Uncharacterized protein n=1 Tax=Trapa incisa TaxID=236973 RepID=A0AAN7QLG7_9MYRT|nr:hypothetical protein SAY87_032014 [Trapa incisa]
MESSMLLCSNLTMLDIFCTCTTLITKKLISYYNQDVKNWDPKRIGALIIYIFVVVLSFQRIYVAIRAPILGRQRKELTEAFMEALIPEPSRSNVRKLKKNVWRRMTLKVLSSKSSLKDLLEHIHDPSYVGEDA